MHPVQVSQAIDHVGNALPADRKLFPPPPEIGELLSIDPEMHEKHIGVRIFLLLTLVAFYKKPPEHHPYSFALAAEAAWSSHVWQRSRAEFARTKFMTFSINDRDRVRVGPGILYFEVGNRREQLRLDEIARVSLWQGIVCFRHQDATWFSRAGKFEFPYGKIANAHVFVMALNKLLGLKLDETGRIEMRDNVV